MRKRIAKNGKVFYLSFSKMLVEAMDLDFGTEVDVELYGETLLVRNALHKAPSPVDIALMLGVSRDEVLAFFALNLADSETSVILRDTHPPLLNDHMSVKSVPLTPKRERLFRYIQNFGSITSAEMAHVFSMSQSAAASFLTRCAEESLLEHRGTHYFLNPDVFNTSPFRIL